MADENPIALGDAEPKPLKRVARRYTIHELRCETDEVGRRTRAVRCAGSVGKCEMAHGEGSPVRT